MTNNTNSHETSKLNGESNGLRQPSCSAGTVDLPCEPNSALPSALRRMPSESESSPDEIKLQLFISNVDFMFILVMSSAFSIFNAIYWTLHS